MSIAVSAVVQPSRMLRVLVGCMCLGALLIAALLIVGRIRSLLLLPRAVLAASCFFASCLGLYRALFACKKYQIDISGLGQIHLVEWPISYSGRSGDSATTVRAELGLVKLLADSTLWPQLLLLRLQSDDGQITALPI